MRLLSLFALFILSAYLQAKVRAHSFRPNRARIDRAAYLASNKPTGYRPNTSAEFDYPNYQLPSSDQCCACDESKYELVFEGLWSKYTHPGEFPESFWEAKFGDIIGASHSSEFKMWEQGSLATEGVKELAETGSTKKLESELKQVSSKTRTIIKARELHYPTLNSKTSAVFRTDRLHHLVSVLSKLNPSPDWMVGVSALELCLPDCSWANQRVINLYLWDAGTDSGQTFEAPDMPTKPQEAIHPFKMSKNQKGLNHRPSAESSSFENQEPDDLAYLSSSFNMDHSKPFARLTITRQRIYEKSCGDESLGSTHQSPAGTSSLEPWQHERPQLQPTYTDCRYTDWSDWSTCSSKCGKGIRTRTRSFLDDRAIHSGCSRADLIDKEVCLSECIGSNVCVTHYWSDWSDCSVSCGKGFRKRTRSPVGLLKKGCEEIELAELEPCIGTQGLNCSSEPSACELSEWSQWSDCSVACGKGTRIRTRQYL